MKTKQQDYDDFKNYVIKRYLENLMEPLLKNKGEQISPIAQYEKMKSEDGQKKTEEDWCGFKNNLNNPSAKEEDKDNTPRLPIELPIIPSKMVYKWCQSKSSKNWNTEDVLLQRLTNILRGDYKLEDAQKDFLEYDEAN